jgi:hypothetical protein
MQCAARDHFFDDLLGDEREEQRHSYFIHGKRKPVRKREVTLRTQICPHEGDEPADGQQKKMFHRKVEDSSEAPPLARSSGKGPVM